MNIRIPLAKITLSIYLIAVKLILTFLQLAVLVTSKDGGRVGRDSLQGMSEGAARRNGERVLPPSLL